MCFHFDDFFFFPSQNDGDLLHNLVLLIVINFYGGSVRVSPAVMPSLVADARAAFGRPSVSSPMTFLITPRSCLTPHETAFFFFGMGWRRPPYGPNPDPNFAFSLRN